MPHHRSVSAFLISFAFLLLWPLISLAQDQSPTMELSGSYRLRFENLDNTFRANADGGDQLLASRLLLRAKINTEYWFGEAEVQDSRSWLDDSGTPLGTDDVNALEPLQFYAGWKTNVGNGRFSGKAGHMTLDIGSRRFVARNRFRNTLNAFTGVHTDWTFQNWRAQAFYTLPVQRLPTARTELDGNDSELDDHHSGIRFWGLHVDHALPSTSSNVEVFLFGIDEEDEPRLATRNRNYLTAGGRLLKTSQPQQWDYEVEAAYQVGEARNSTAPTDTIDLDHKAYFIHVHLGYQTADRWASRWVLQFDYASGDKSPADDQSSRFDTLFGARRFDFGPTGIYGAFARSNMMSPGARWEFKANNNFNGFIGYRAVLLAEKQDALTTANVRDASGNSGDFVGQQLEARLRIAPHKNWEIELGAAYLLKRSFLENAPNAPDTGDTSYAYVGVSYRF